MKRIIFLLLFIAFLGSSSYATFSYGRVFYSHTHYNKVIDLQKNITKKTLSPFKILKHKLQEYSSKLLMLSVVIIVLGLLFALLADRLIGGLIIGIGIVVLLFALL